jgi:hypothetical protein
MMAAVACAHWLCVLGRIAKLAGAGGDLCDLCAVCVLASQEYVHVSRGVS